MDINCKVTLHKAAGKNCRNLINDNDCTNYKCGFSLIFWAANLLNESVVLFLSYILTVDKKFTINTNNADCATPLCAIFLALVFV